MENSYIPVVITGAPRSGTNMLRDVMTRLHKIGTWPCDEINYIWRHGNINHPSDEFDASMATDRIKQFIRREFFKIASRYDLQYVVEKTCANSLRVSFVNSILPNCLFIHIVRDGRDTIASAMKRWRGGVGLKYALEKARFIPLSDLPHHFFQQLGRRLAKLFGKGKTVTSWGPRFDGIDETVRNESLAFVCARQWQACVESADRDFEAIDSARVLEIKYEEFVTQPIENLREICDFLGYKTEGKVLSESVTDVSAKSIGNWRRDRAHEEITGLIPILSETLGRHGYS